MSIEAMKQLIEDCISLMEYHIERTRPIHSTTVAIQAAKEALKAIAEAEKQERFFCERCGKRLSGGIHTCTPPAEAEKQEPWGTYMGHRLTPAGTKEFWGFADLQIPEGSRLYTHPPKQWVGLTDEEMHECWDSPLTPLGMKHARMIEAKLKQKNGYAEEKNSQTG
jgi:hypothetical protein